MKAYIKWFDELSMRDIALVGGKNASLGEMYSHLTKLGVNVPAGFATTTEAYRDFLEANDLSQRIKHELDQLDVDDVAMLAITGKAIRTWLIEAVLPDQLLEAISIAYEKLEKSAGGEVVSFAVRSSATAEDLADASFAGQQETLLNVSGLDQIIQAIKIVFASLYNDRAIAYRVHQNFPHDKVYLSVGIQKMVRSDLGASGVMFTLDTESGFQDAIFVTSAYGLGETIVQGIVNPDEFYVYKQGLRSGKSAILSRRLGTKLIEMVYENSFKQDTFTVTRDVSVERRQRFSLSDQQIEQLGQQALLIEQHYGRPMDIEWALDGLDGKLYIVQARPETVKSRAGTSLERYHLTQKGMVLSEGRAIGQKIGQGTAKVIFSIDQMHEIQSGDVLVTDMTDPDWEPIMKRAAAIVTNRGGRTCHAAIIAREMGIPAVVGCGEATSQIKPGSSVTISCAEGDTGYVYEGLLAFEHSVADMGQLPQLPIKMMMNVGNPSHAFAFSQIPNQGIGLARLEFIISNMIGIHPKAVLEFDQLPSDLQALILGRSAGYANPVQFYVEKLVEGIATLAAAFYPNPVIVRTSDFKSNEYANLIGGERYEPKEENPMIGFRGASRYISPQFQACFELECQALRKVRDEMGLTNVEIMIPFCRTLEEAQQVTALLASQGLSRGRNGLRVIMMCEIPSNALLAEEFLQFFDGFSIGSNDMTQLCLGLDRDSSLVAHAFDERNPAVKKILKMAIDACRTQGKYIGICGQGPSDYPDFAAWLNEVGISSLSLNPDSIVETWLYLASLTKQN
ncbi:MAG TPA: phosphoenolpyruvate synthase [Nitrosomonas sp.]|nr:phosphoenolpyruvate synthase [Nitrosomonas sp.]HMW68177.1 phosphoenolpyruvate synthase [Nitrosomonas sp.]HMY60871.1 phosphoenolpyruvate synthase [Nitrosomonas sp.]HNC40486.1 phosphoenolpyruvate synthase [Nitrosomonas sp.]HNE56821.1 phosphoenolpyruvate synthase [Nitrosomonas sp.]